MIKKKSIRNPLVGRIYNIEILLSPKKRRNIAYARIRTSTIPPQRVPTRERSLRVEGI